MNTITEDILLATIFEKLKSYVINYQLTNPLEFYNWCKSLYLKDLGFQTKTFLIEGFDEIYDICICKMETRVEIQIKFDYSNKSLEWMHEHKDFKTFVYDPVYIIVPLCNTFYDRKGCLQLTHNQYERLARLLGLEILLKEDDTIHGFTIPRIDKLIKNDKSRNLP